MLRILIAFFAGVIVTVLVLAPGEAGWKNLTETTRTGDFEAAAEKIEQTGEMAGFYAMKAKQRLCEKFQ